MINQYLDVPYKSYIKAIFFQRNKLPLRLTIATGNLSYKTDRGTHSFHLNFGKSVREDVSFADRKFQTKR